MKARILLKADAREAGEAWSGNQVIEATSASMVYRLRTQYQRFSHTRFADMVQIRKNPRYYGVTAKLQSAIRSFRVSATIMVELRPSLEGRASRLSATFKPRRRGASNRR
jgi:hypothetical protein